MVMDMFIHLTMMTEKKYLKTVITASNQGEVDITEDVMKDLEQMKSVN
jgi:hypothetical protein